MSIRFTKSPATYVQDSSVSFTTPVTLSFSVYIDDPTSDTFPFLINLVEASTGYRFGCLYALSLDSIRPRYDMAEGGSADNLIGSASEKWIDICLVAYDTSYDGWVNGSQILDGEAYGGSRTFSGVTFDRFELGGYSNSELDGYMANVGLWNTSITDDQAKSLSNGFIPTIVRPQDLELYISETQSTYADALQNISLSAPVSEPTFDNSFNPFLIFPE